MLLMIALSAVIKAYAVGASPSPATTPGPANTQPAALNTTAPGVNATVTTVIPPQFATATTKLVNVSLSSLGLSVGAAASQFTASFPAQSQNTTTSPLPTRNASVGTFLPPSATETVTANNSRAVLIPDPSWGAAIIVSNASSLNATQLVVSNATSLGSATVFTTVYNTTTVS